MKDDTVMVPCNGCRACCYGPVMLHPSLGDDPPRYRTVTVRDVGIMLARRADGSCIYLGETGCTIWGRQPALCKKFDCRVYAVSAWARIDPHRDPAVIMAGKDRLRQAKAKALP